MSAVGRVIAAAACAAAALGAAQLGPAAAGELSETIKRVKPGIVAVGTYQATRRPPARLFGSGFAVADGGHVVTSAHVLPDKIETGRREHLAVFVPAAESSLVVKVEVVGTDVEHDVAILRLSGHRLPALVLGDDAAVEEGQPVAITGYPIGGILGLYPATHRGIVAATPPIAVPQLSLSQLDPRMIRQLREGATVFQLDATAYPGNSGSPLYDPHTGEVYGLVNSVFIKGTKERALRNPSGITYATPIRHAKALLAKLGLAP